jgi:Tfp pilus assembly protein PilV
MLEVLVALMISFAFLMGTMNAMVIAAVMQVKAERQAQALYWIQQDLESVRAAADNFPDTSPTSSCGTLANAFTTASTGGLPAVSPSTQLLVNKSYVLERTSTASGNVLQLSYRVGENNGSGTIATTTNSVIASLYTEVLPAAALSC